MKRLFSIAFVLFALLPYKADRNFVAAAQTKSQSQTQSQTQSQSQTESQQQTNQQVNHQSNHQTKRSPRTDQHFPRVAKPANQTEIQQSTQSQNRQTQKHQSEIQQSTQTHQTTQSQNRQTTTHQKHQSLTYHPATELLLINKGFTATLTPFTRIPAYLRDSVRPDLWERSLCSAGLALRFASNSTQIAVRYRLTNNFHMPHMADTGIKGTDLYCLDSLGRWHYINTARPTDDSIQSKTYVANLDGNNHEWLIYLPLYDGIEWLEVGIDSTATLSKPLITNPVPNKKIVFYGTSIMQGGCASRTGMAATNIIQRELGIECVNLGFSGEGKLDPCIARAMTTIPDVAAFVIDPVPNCTKDMCDSLTYAFVNILRQARPEVPIIMVEGPFYPYAHYDAFFRDYLPLKNEAFHRNFMRLKAENPNNIYYITSDQLNAPNDEGTVDGIHLTDLGFRAYADMLEKRLIPLLNK